MRLLSKNERLSCPVEFERRITEAGGRNRYGNPNFRIIWGQTETCVRGGFWPATDNSPEFTGYREVLEGSGVPCWILQMWKAPECFGTPLQYFMENRDESTGLQVLGDYPWKGRYDTLNEFICREFQNGRLTQEIMPLNSVIIDLIIPIVQQAQAATQLMRYTALKDREEKKQAALTQTIDDKRRDARMAFKGNPVSYARQGCRTSLIDQKIMQLEADWKRLMRIAKLMPKGTTIYKPN
jgi:hypothetical protein